MADIFISYAREDRETAKTLAQALADQGWSVWWDRQVPSGRWFYEVIDRELTAARCVIVLWSAAALSSHWVREEAEDGLRRNILVPAQIEAMDLLPLGFRTIQTADLVGWEGDQAHPGFAQLVADLTATLGEAPPAAKPSEVFVQLGHTDSVLSVAFSPDGHFALSGSGDHTLRLWEIASRREVHSFTGHTGGVLSVAFSPDGRFALSGSNDGSLRLWRNETGALVLTLVNFNDNGWIALTPEGYFTSSPNAVQHISVRINNNEVRSMEEFRSIYESPDRVATAIL